MIKIAILYICTGKYNQFFKGFYESSEKYFLNGNYQKDYFVFTDDMRLSTAANVHLFERKCQGFPLDSLFRFDMFLSIKEKLKAFDYCFFFNANLLFVKPVGEEFLPKEEGLMAVRHPKIYKRPSFLFPYERNKESLAYIAPKGGQFYYYMGSLNGGRVEDFMKLADVCSHNTHIDYDKGIIAYFHDESHLNRYMRDHKCKAMSPAYAYPEGDSLPFEPIILLRDKEKIDPYFIKKKEEMTLVGKVMKLFDYAYRAIIWYI